VGCPFGCGRGAVLNWGMLEYLNIHQMIAELVFLGMLAAGNAALLRYVLLTFEPGMINAWWLPFVVRMLIRKPAPELIDALGAAQNPDHYRNILIAYAHENLFWFKPLGGCAPCTLMPFSLCTFAALWFALPFFTLYVYICALYYFALSSAWLRWLSSPR